jgi:hypothetical protein
MPSTAVAFEVLRRLGLRPSLHYLVYQAQLRSGWFRLSAPSGHWAEKPGTSALLSQPKHFAIACDDELRQALGDLPVTSLAQAVAAAEDVLQGRFALFGRQRIDVGFPPDWGAFVPLVANPPPPVRSDAHWSALELDALPGDIKLVWELSRFEWAYALGRAYVFTGEERFAGGFWALLNSWRQTNPPNLGPQWISGQEVALRMMALIFAWRAFDPWLASDEARQGVLLETIEVHARRLPPSLSYALAQDNNHLLVEAAALLATGIAFPGLRRADSWRKQGRELLEQAVRRQFFADGGYMQHSANYARLALQAILWAAAGARRSGEPLSARVSLTLE